jgi:hypothetical protein
MSSTASGQGVLGHVLEVTVDDVESWSGEAFGGHEAAGDGLLVVVPGQHGADERDDGGTVGDPDLAVAVRVDELRRGG